LRHAVRQQLALGRVMIGMRERENIGQQLGRKLDIGTVDAGDAIQVAERIGEIVVLAEHAEHAEAGKRGTVDELLDILVAAAGIEERHHRADHDAAGPAFAPVLRVPFPDTQRAAQRAALAAVQREQEGMLAAALAQRVAHRRLYPITGPAGLSL
jgi:hypothetical protein